MSDVTEVVNAIGDLDRARDDDRTILDKNHREVMKELAEIKALEQQILDHLPTAQRVMKDAVGELKLAKNQKDIFKVIRKFFRGGESQ